MLQDQMLNERTAKLEHTTAQLKLLQGELHAARVRHQTLVMELQFLEEELSSRQVDIPSDMHQF